MYSCQIKQLSKRINDYLKIIVVEEEEEDEEEKAYVVWSTG